MRSTRCWSAPEPSHGRDPRDRDRGTGGLVAFGAANAYGIRLGSEVGSADALLARELAERVDPERDGEGAAWSHAQLVAALT